MIRLRTASALAVGAVAALALGGTALAAGHDDVAAPAPSASASSPAPASGGPSSSAAAAGAISMDAAKAIAIKAAGGGQVTSVEQETEHGRAVWDVEVQVGDVEHDVDVDRASGAVLRHGNEHGDASSDDHGSDD